MNVGILKLRPNEHKNVPGPAEESSRSVGHWSSGQGRTMYNGLTRTGVATLHECVLLREVLF